MGAETAIQWTDSTWNPVGGCEIHSPGCIKCYAMGLAGSGRLRNHPVYKGTTSIVKGKPVFNGILTILPDDHPGWQWPLKWRGAKHPVMGRGQPSLIFVDDMADLFHARRPIEHIDRVIATILWTNHIGQLLTKRADVMADYFLQPFIVNRLDEAMQKIRPRPQFSYSADADGWPHPRLWLGISAERQKELNERWALVKALAALGWTIFISIEPMLERMALPADLLAYDDRIQIIIGGESGHDARAFDISWARDILKQCVQAGVACFVKQLGSNAFDSSREDDIPEHPADADPADIAQFEAAFVKLRLKNRKGGDPKEWPVGLSYRQFPRMAT